MKYESGWLVNWYIDACHSGSCKDETEKWLINKMNCVVGSFDINKDDKGGLIRRDLLGNYSKCSLHCLDRDAFLKFTIYMSSTAS